jgi:hypothetical protein
MQRIDNVLSVDTGEAYKSQNQNTGRVYQPLEQLTIDCSWMNTD